VQAFKHLGLSSKSTNKNIQTLILKNRISDPENLVSDPLGSGNHWCRVWGIYRRVGNTYPLWQTLQLSLVITCKPCFPWGSLEMRSPVYRRRGHSMTVTLALTRIELSQSGSSSLEGVLQHIHKRQRPQALLNFLRNKHINFYAVNDFSYDGEFCYIFDSRKQRSSLAIYRVSAHLHVINFTQTNYTSWSKRCED